MIAMMVENFFKKARSNEMKLKEAKEQQNIFKSNLNKISKGRFKLEEQESSLENIKLLRKSREGVIKLFNDYLMIILLSLYLRPNTKQNIKKVLKY